MGSSKACGGGSEGSASRLRCDIYGGQDFCRRSLMHHMSSRRNRAEDTVRNFSMQFARLLALNKSIFRASNDDHRHLQVPIGVSERTRSRDHESCFSCGSPQLRGAHSHLLREAFEFLRNRGWAKNFAEKQWPH